MNEGLICLVILVALTILFRLNSCTGIQYVNFVLYMMLAILQTTITYACI